LKVLVDESLPVGLAAELTDFEVSTVRAQRWLGLQNGVLLRAAVDAGFDVLLTADRALRHQQNLARIGIGVVLLVRLRNRMSELRPLLAHQDCAAGSKEGRAHRDRRATSTPVKRRFARCRRGTTRMNGGVEAFGVRRQSRRFDSSSVARYTGWSQGHAHSPG
jgi:hypothetical protein